MGKKPKSQKAQARAQRRHVDEAGLPPPPIPVDEELGSSKLLKEPKVPGSGYRALNQEGYDDGGVADLTLVIDLDDNVLRRKRGHNAYFQALKNDLVPRVTTGPTGALTRRDQKIKLAKLLFSEDDEDDPDYANPSEVYVDNVDGSEDEATKARRLDRLNSAKFALRLSSVLREPACASLSLSEISKRYLAAYGKDGAENALRCADKAIEIAGNGFYDSDLVAIEANENPIFDPKHEVNATSPGLSHSSFLKLLPIRVSQLCLRSAYLHRGNALAALGREEEARETYQNVLPMLEKEPRCGRLDWERSSIIVNIGNTYSRQGEFAKASEQYDIAEKLGQDHLDIEDGNKADGLGIKLVSMRARSFALKKAGKEDEAKQLMREVIQLQLKYNEESQKEKERMKVLQEEQDKEMLEAAQTENEAIQ